MLVGASSGCVSGISGIRVLAAGTGAVGAIRSWRSSASITIRSTCACTSCSASLCADDGVGVMVSQDFAYTSDMAERLDRKGILDLLEACRA